MLKWIFFKTVINYELLKETIKYNNSASQTEIASIIGKSQTWVSHKIIEYNKAENELLGTCNKNYFNEYEKVEYALFIRTINKMIHDTKILPILPLFGDKKLMEIYNTSKLVVDKYIKYILNNESKNAYFNKLPDEIKKEISS